MTEICDDHEIDFTECGCRFRDSSCINVSGKGSVENPVVLTPNFDPDERQIASCNPYGDGIYAQMQDRFIWPTMRKVRNIPHPLAADDVIPFSTVEYDPYGMSIQPEVAQIPFDAKWAVHAYAAFDNNNASYNTIRLEFHQGVAYGIIMANREQRDRQSTDKSFVFLNDEFAMKTGDWVRITIGEDAKEDAGSPKTRDPAKSGVITITRASLVITLVSL